jgi:hypothetical protein
MKDFGGFHLIKNFLKITIIFKYLQLSCFQELEDLVQKVTKVKLRYNIQILPTSKSVASIFLSERVTTALNRPIHEISSLKKLLWQN